MIGVSMKRLKNLQRREISDCDIVCFFRKITCNEENHTQIKL